MYLVSSPSVESTVQVATFRPLFLWVVWGMSQNKSKYLLYYKNDQDNTKIFCSMVFNLTDPREQLFVNAETGNEAAMHSVERTLAFCCVRLTFCRCFSEYCCRGQDVKSSSHRRNIRRAATLVSDDVWSHLPGIGKRLLVFSRRPWKRIKRTHISARSKGRKLSLS